MPRDRIFVSFGFQGENAAVGPGLFARCGIVEGFTYRQSVYGANGYIRLPRQDPRLPTLIAALKDAGVHPHPRFDRDYTKQELDRAAFLVLVGGTAGLEGSANFKEQPFDRSNACAVCGAGAFPLAPLIIRTSKMGKKLMDSTSHDGQIVVSSALGQALADAELTGFTLQNVRPPSKPTADPRWHWLKPHYQWPPVTNPEFLYRWNPCPSCTKSGYYADWNRPTAFVHSELPKDALDIGVSYEQFGNWFWHTPGDNPDSVAGARMLIVSQRARQELLKQHVRSTSFEPVFTLDDPILKDWPTDWSV